MNGNGDGVYIKKYKTRTELYDFIISYIYAIENNLKDENIFYENYVILFDDIIYIITNINNIYNILTSDLVISYMILKKIFHDRFIFDSLKHNLQHGHTSNLLILIVASFSIAMSYSHESINNIFLRKLVNLSCRRFTSLILKVYKLINYTPFTLNIDNWYNEIIFEQINIKKYKAFYI